MVIVTNLICIKLYYRETLSTTVPLLTIMSRSIYFSILCFVMTAAQADGLFDFQMKLAKKGNAEAQYMIGEMYETGFGVEKNMDEAAKWVIRSAKKGNAAAKYKLLYWDIQKNGITLNNKEKAKALKRRANEGDEYAQYYLGMMYAHGVGATKKPEEGLAWLNKAALAGVLAAETEIAAAKETVIQAESQRKQADLKKQRAAESQRAQQQKKVRARLESQRRAEERRADARVREEEARQASIAAAEKQRRQAALLKAQAEREEKHKEEFESDPCSGKSARFLSTCR